MINVNQIIKEEIEQYMTDRQKKAKQEWKNAEYLFNEAGYFSSGENRALTSLTPKEQKEIKKIIIQMDRIAKHAHHLMDRRDFAANREIRKSMRLRGDEHSKSWNSWDGRISNLQQSFIELARFIEKKYGISVDDGNMWWDSLA